MVPVGCVYVSVTDTSKIIRYLNNTDTLKTKCQHNL